jgi:hypothetical protein
MMIAKRILPAAAVVYVICSWPLAGISLAQTSPRPNVQPPSKDQSLRQFLQTWDKKESPDATYISAFPDLNGDGKPEAIVQFTSRDWCGTGGCTILMLEQKGETWKIVTRIIVAHAPVRVLNMTHHGWHSIGVLVCGGGIIECYEAELPYDGKTYAKYPTVPPARRLKGDQKGEVVISKDQKGVSLYK